MAKVRAWDAPGAKRCARASTPRIASSPIRPRYAIGAAREDRITRSLVRDGKLTSAARRRWQKVAGAVVAHSSISERPGQALPKRSSP